MTLNHNDQSAIRQYLLRQMSDEQQQELEQRVLIEDDLFEELEVSETQLIDEYVAGELNPEEREQFEQHFLTTAKRESDLEFARVLKRYTVSRGRARSDSLAHFPPVQPPWRTSQSWWSSGEASGWLRAAAVVAFVAVLAATLWFALDRSPSPQLATLNLTLSTSNRAEGVAVPRVQLPSEGLKLVLKLPDGSAPTTNYRARLLSEDGETRTFEIAERNAQSVSVVVPAQQLKRGPYALKLITLTENGAELPLNGSYFFTVE